LSGLVFLMVLAANVSHQACKFGDEIFDPIILFFRRGHGGRILSDPIVRDSKPASNWNFFRGGHDAFPSGDNVRPEGVFRFYHNSLLKSVF